MQKIIVIGCPGAGKSVFARALHEKTGLPLCHLDQLFWNADRTTVTRELFRARLAAVLATDAWIIDGNYASTMEERMAACDTVLFLDYPTEVCLDGVRARRGKPRPDLPWIETAEDAEFMDYIKDFQAKSRPAILELLARQDQKRVVAFSSRAEADAYLQGLEKTKFEKENF
jgi:adenylate kinase family enzyme